LAKAYSPFKAAVDEAVKYADAHGVLMVHAAGNDGQDPQQEAELPVDGTYLSGGKPNLWLEVGRIVLERGRQPGGEFLQLRTATGRTCCAGRRHSSRRFRAISTRRTAARAWRRRS
jgi:hypothetical protein